MIIYGFDLLLVTIAVLNGHFANLCQIVVILFLSYTETAFGLIELLLLILISLLLLVIINIAVHGVISDTCTV